MFVWCYVKGCTWINSSYNESLHGVGFFFGVGDWQTLDDNVVIESTSLVLIMINH